MKFVEVEAGLNRKAGTAAAASLRLGISHLKRLAAKGFDKVDGRPAHQIQADGIHHQRCARTIGANIIGRNAFGQAEAILKSGTASAFDRQAQYRWLTKLDSNLGNPPGGVIGHGYGRIFRHTPYVGRPADKEKGRQSFLCQPPNLHPLPKVMRLAGKLTRLQLARLELCYQQFYWQARYLIQRSKATERLSD